MARTTITADQLEKLAEAANYSAKRLAALCNRSPRQLQREFHRMFNQTPQEWLDKLRLKTAEQPLLSGEQIKRVASDLGYKHTSHFCRHFKVQYNMTPSQFVAATFLQATNGADI